MQSLLTFLGAAGTVTGSRHLLETRGRRLLVDCGLFQGRKEDRLKNWEPFPVDPRSIDAVLLTHAHIDHIGYLPRLVKEGFTGPIHATHPTAALLEVLLEDTAHLQEEEARWANRKGYSKHSPALPLYGAADVPAVLRRVEAISFGEHFHPAPGIRAQYRGAGHILGAAWLDLVAEDRDPTRKLLFSGDVGRPTDPILWPPAQPYNVDYLVLESTYGDRLHSHHPSARELARVVRESAERGGALIIPSFAVGRSQTLLYLLRELEEAREIPDLPVFLDSPMALEALEIHRDHIRDLGLEARRRHLEGVALFRPRHLRESRTTRDSIAINDLNGPLIIIAGSGMVNGGRVLHHIKQRGSDPSTTFLFIGYQAVGTRGHSLLNGAKSLRMFGRDIPINAHIERIDGFSGHADYMELSAWLMGFNQPVEEVFLVHGDDDAASTFAGHLKDQFGWKTTVPDEGDRCDIDF